MNKRRLLKLAKFLREKVPDEHFDLWSFVSPPERKSDTFAVRQLPKIASGKTHGCGTVACAIGWCPGAFPGEWVWTIHGDNVRLKNRKDGNAWLYAREFFGIDGDEVRYLFGIRAEERSRLEVARRIEQFVARGGLPKKPQEV